VLSARVRPSSSCLPHVFYGVCQVGSALTLPAFSQRSLHNFLHQCPSLLSFLLRLVWSVAWPRLLAFLLLVYLPDFFFPRFSRPG